MRILILGSALLLAACGGEAEQAGNAAAEAEVPAAFPAGQWTLTSTVESIGSTDKSTPAIAAKTGDKATRTVCAADSKTLDALFVPANAKCSAMTDYARQGRVNTAYKCTVPGGQLNVTVNGNYTADTLEALVDSASMLSGSGDYQMREKVTGRRVGDCPAAG